MAGNISFGGLASGLDTESLVTRLLAAESGAKIRYQRQLDVTEGRKNTLSEIHGKLRALGTAVADLRAPTLFAQTQSITSSDPARIAVTRTGSVGTGAYMLSVSQVASAQQRSYTYTAPGAADGITVGGHTTALAAGATRDDAITAINADPSAKVWASSLGDGKIALSWRATGDDFNGDVVTSGALSAEDPYRPGKDAKYRIDGGVEQTSSTNEIADKIAGLSFTIKSTTSADVAITVGAPGPDVDKITGKLKAFVDAYNAANDLIRNELREDKVKNATSKVDRGKGAVRGDATLTALQSSLRQALGTVVGTGRTAADTLADLGITTGGAAGEAKFSQDAVNGRLTLDEAKLKETLAAEPSAVKQLLGGTGNGIAQALEAVLQPAVGADGMFDQRARSADSELTRIRSSMTAFDERLAQREKTLRAMFTRLESSLASSQSQGSALSSQLARL